MAILLVVGHHPRPGLPNQEIKEVSGRYDKGCVRDCEHTLRACLLLQDRGADLLDCQKDLVAHTR